MRNIQFDRASAPPAGSYARSAGGVGHQDLADTAAAFVEAVAQLAAMRTTLMPRAEHASSHSHGGAADASRATHPCCKDSTGRNRLVGPERRRYTNETAQPHLQAAADAEVGPEDGNGDGRDDDNGYDLSAGCAQSSPDASKSAGAVAAHTERLRSILGAIAQVIEVRRSASALSDAACLRGNRGDTRQSCLITMCVTKERHGLAQNVASGFGHHHV